MTIHRIIAADHPGDNLRVELTSMFAALPSARLSITRHGVPALLFSLAELAAVGAALVEMQAELALPAPRPAMTAAEHNQFPGGRW